MDSRENLHLEVDGPLYRPAKPMPFELVQHCGIYLEEKLYTQALNLLTHILTSGTVAGSPAFVPTPALLAVAATLVVYPGTTNRAKTAEEKEAASAALRLLRLTNTLVGPLAARFDAAFSFTHFETSRQGARRRQGNQGARHNDGDHMETHREHGMPLNFHLGQSGSLWSRAEDFWHAVGWAFNCSILHLDRWERWRLWLQFICEALEDDWSERVRQSDGQGDEEETGQDDGNAKDQLLRDSLIFRYLLSESGGYGRNRRIMRAIFANGSPSAVGEFRQIFNNEQKDLKPDKDNHKKREGGVNIDQDEYGDYITHDEAESDETEESVAPRPRTNNRPKRARRATKAAGAQNTDPTHSSDTTTTTTTAASIVHSGLSLLGGYESLVLRQRLLHLLSTVSERFPKEFVPLDDLYHMFVENIRHQPFPIFQAFVTPAVLPYFSPAAQTTLCEFLLFRMRESSAPDTDEEYLSQTKLEECFLPFAANSPSIVENAKVSVTLESLLVLLAESEMLDITPSLRSAVQAGIVARADKAQLEVRKSHTDRLLEDTEWCWLLESGERLNFLVDVALLRRRETLGDLPELPDAE
ncbi:hypothetical protein ASPZODRAFT_150175 [Penicilliopsis zonata CBS 506.65]|uniref:Uncharacterized protein n=1 Tax=Penicilliopsis zonata CBS 506.65 TaxID=1073090 RepID=A0A1L9SQ09_9EURO|nr:hypothetical protein ASPZODRAFT_150175 [Penicilliopsis zonata CBS 506.65]OJJ49258.1 hypothetical protein ASPZODRAFT_150175 [Penicilliopsis zonata CBS 506.65]